MNSVATEFERLVSIMNELREKCPWDKKQTIHTLRSMTLEEAYELADAIIDEDWQHIKEELGDLLLHIIFYAKIAAEQSQFTLQQTIESICNKLIVRHPHVYSDTVVNDEEDVKRNWEKIKMQEGKKSILSGVPVSLSAVIKAMRIQERAKQVGFEWDKREDVYKKIEEEMNELQHAIKNNDKTHIEEELGDVFFSLINYARFLHVDAEAALEKTNKKFIQRFTKMENMAAQKGKSLIEMTLPEMDKLWDIIKNEKTVS